MNIITRDQYLMGRDKEYPISALMEKHMMFLLDKVNQLAKPIYEETGEQLIVSSGYRPDAINKKILGAAKNSLHSICLAVDCVDKDGKIMAFMIKNYHLPKALLLRIEHGAYTKGWIHFDGKNLGENYNKTFYIPYNGAPLPQFYNPLFKSLICF